MQLIQLQKHVKVAIIRLLLVKKLRQVNYLMRAVFIHGQVKVLSLAVTGITEMGKHCKLLQLFVGLAPLLYTTNFSIGPFAHVLLFIKHTLITVIITKCK